MQSPTPTVTEYTQNRLPIKAQNGTAHEKPWETRIERDALERVSHIIPPRAHQLYVALYGRKNQQMGDTVWPSIATMAEWIGASVATVKRARAELETVGLIERAGKTSNGTTIYKIHPPDTITSKVAQGQLTVAHELAHELPCTPAQICTPPQLKSDLTPGSKVSYKEVKEEEVEEEEAKAFFCEPAQKKMTSPAHGHESDPWLQQIVYLFEREFMPLFSVALGMGNHGLIAHLFDDYRFAIDEYFFTFPRDTPAGRRFAAQCWDAGMDTDLAIMGDEHAYVGPMLDLWRDGAIETVWAIRDTSPEAYYEWRDSFLGGNEDEQTEETHPPDPAHANPVPEAHG